MLKELKRIGSYHGKYGLSAARIKPVRKDNVIIRYTDSYTALKKLTGKAEFNIDLMKYQESADNLIENESKDIIFKDNKSFPEPFEHVFGALKNDTVRVVFDRGLLIRLLQAMDSTQIELRLSDTEKNGEYSTNPTAIIGKNERALIMPLRRKA